MRKYSISVRDKRDDHWEFLAYNISLPKLIFLWIRYNKYDIIEIHAYKEEK